MTQTSARAAMPADDAVGALRAWASDAAARTVELGRRLLRFAFYGRYSTEDRQNPTTLLRVAAWPGRGDRHRGRARITEEFFDEGQSRTRSWHLRPEAARLIEAIKDPNRNFDAIVLGSYERAFYDNQASLILPPLEKHGVAQWRPEVGGPVTAGHDELVALLGILAKREIIRARARTIGVMTALVRDYGRYLGGRPAYGYRLIAVRPHPKRQHAAWVRKLLCLEPNPETALEERPGWAARRHATVRLKEARPWPIRPSAWDGGNPASDAKKRCPRAALRGEIMCPRGDLNPHALNGH
jgi:site-specific DNA recombinase